ncbi:hypothetical protein ABFY41_13130 [Acinetobacter haemolyticus]|uniref:hypothetical protein n=1 Tax=Acinetobacter TaxID=469 RepID=UPI0030F41793
MGIKKNVVAMAILAIAMVAASTGAFAIEAADVTAATGSSGADDSISAGWKWVLGIAITLFAGRKIIGMFGK